ncbi:MAG: carboxymuconolactone decarboxylase family protein [Pseudolabrys sp.]
MSRLLDLSPEVLTPEQTTIFDRLVAGRGRILGPYKIWIHSPAVASAMEQLGTFLNKRSSLSSREVELCILLIARHWQADYVMQAHIKEGKRVGLSDEVLRDLMAAHEPTLANQHERYVYRFSSALVSGVKIPEAEFDDVAAAIGREGIAEVLALLGYYTSVALGMKVHEVSVPPEK